MPEYKIDKGIPVPKKGYVKDVVLKMDVGDSVLFTDKKEAHAFCAAMKKYCKAAMHKVDGGWRVWKVG